jgi:hypothetical protein
VMDVWDVYKEIKERRDQTRALIEVVERTRSWDEPLLNALTEHERWATNTLEKIDVANGRVTEADGG